MKAAARTDSDDRIGYVGCFCSIPVGMLLAIGVCLRIGSNAMFAWGIVSILMAVGIVWGAWKISGFRSRPYVAELRRRFGQRSFERCLRESALAFRSSQPPNTVLVCQGKAVNESVYTFIRAEIQDAKARRGRVEVLMSPRFPCSAPLFPGSDEDPRKEIRRTERDLSPQEVDRLAEVLLGALKPGPAAAKRRLSSGYAFEIGVLKGPGRPAFRAACDVLATPDSQMDAAAPMLLRAILTVAEGACESYLLKGWAEAIGDAGQRGFHEYVDEARQDLMGTDSPDKILLFQGFVGRQPHAPYFALVRIELGQLGSPPGRARVATSPRFDSLTEFNSTGVQRDQSDLSAEDADRLREFAAGIGPGSLANIPSTISEGYPCQVAVVDKNPPGVKLGSCNLIGTAEANANLPAPTLARMIIRAAEGASASPMIRGWSEYTGDHASAPYSVEVARKTIQADNAPDWIVLLSLSVLPYGGAQSVRIDVREDPAPRARICVRRCPDRCQGDDPRLTVECTAGDLSPANAAMLASQLEGLRPASLMNVPSEVDDGAPCTVEVLRKHPHEVWQGGCNLAGVEERHLELPTLVLIRTILRLAAGAAPGKRRMVFGACDSMGNITLGEL